MAWRNDERIDSGLDFMILFLTFPISSCSVSRHRSVFSVAAIDTSFFFFWVSNQCIQIHAHSKGKKKKKTNKMPLHKQTGYWNLSIFLCLKLVGNTQFSSFLCWFPFHKDSERYLTDITKTQGTVLTVVLIDQISILWFTVFLKNGKNSDFSNNIYITDRIHWLFIWHDLSKTN